MSDNKKNFETLAVRTQSETTQFSEHSVPLYLTSGFVFDDAEEMRSSFAEEKQRDLYSRYSNPNTNEFIEKVCLMEGAEAGFAFSSGMAAIFSTFGALLSAGDHVVSCSSVFGATHGLFTKYFPKWNINCSYFDVKDVDKIESLIQPTTKFIYAETPTNPGVDVLDLELLSSIAKKHGILLIIDNCFATPYLQQPIKFGADLVIHSATKLMDGQGRVMGGITVGNKDLIREIYLFSRLTGPCMSPFNAWVLSKSLETLAVRADRHCDNALKLAEFLESHPKVKWVKYPFLKSHPQYETAKKQMKLGGSIVAFEVEGGVEGGRNFFDNIKMCSLSANLGDTRTIVTHPASTTHAKVEAEVKLAVGITDGMVRCSLGLEHIDDIIADIKQALEA
ncbi:aminotransferase class I/II-fold pyridoxal phosphate-dependent enzyme [Wenyingzhuangia sp. chi5]|uniref:Aminotransferase class I/II-fold pyridoxal phosphate-dependent enzyme n=1 Tax=Wenyingzhuangia gilva TaxID=3057677 RepID=A0ABT8VNM7_9FLAO|nr:aminotransferase class I/II-fold pyridoxal phosphate-dependent enzyme [Wenyingzhuangia sp. chi5]MDO3693574.1 aminotransferase class I/II-fold pyridoxal phosphate-dependent enzyme [Wenyingzhuangia sp. chi5]